MLDDKPEIAADLRQVDSVALAPNKARPDRNGREAILWSICLLQTERSSLSVRSVTTAGCNQHGNPFQTQLGGIGWQAPQARTKTARSARILLRVYGAWNAGSGAGTLSSAMCTGKRSCSRIVSVPMCTNLGTFAWRDNVLSACATTKAEIVATSMWPRHLNNPKHRRASMKQNQTVTLA